MKKKGLIACLLATLTLSLMGCGADVQSDNDVLQPTDSTIPQLDNDGTIPKPDAMQPLTEMSREQFEEYMANNGPKDYNWFLDTINQCDGTLTGMYCYYTVNDITGAYNEEPYNNHFEGLFETDTVYFHSDTSIKSTVLDDAQECFYDISANKGYTLKDDITNAIYSDNYVETIGYNYQTLSKIIDTLSEEDKALVTVERFNTGKGNGATLSIPTLGFVYTINYDVDYRYQSIEYEVNGMCLMKSALQGIDVNNLSGVHDACRIYYIYDDVVRPDMDLMYSIVNDSTTDSGYYDFSFLNNPIFISNDN